MTDRAGLRVDPADMRGMINALDKIAREAQSTLDDGARVAAKHIASKASRRAAGLSGASRLVAGAIGAQGETVSIRPGGRASRYASVGDLMFAAEYGARAPQTRKHWPGHPWRGSGSGAGYFLWPAIRESDDQIMDDWTSAFDTMLKRTW